MTKNSLTLVQIRLLKSIAANEITLDGDTTDWLSGHIIALTMFDPPLIDIIKGIVVLTEAGRALLAPVANTRQREPEL